MRQAVALVTWTSPVLASLGARNCYDSFTKAGCRSIAEYIQNDPDDHELIDRIANRHKHESVIEHTVFTFVVVTNRAVLQQLARHRIASFSVRSTRYTLKKALKSKEDFLRRNIIFVNQRPDIYKAKQEAVESLYNSLYYIINKSPTPRNDDFKEIIPESFYTVVVLTMNARSLKNFLKLRTDKHAWAPIREIALLMALRVLEHVGEDWFKALFGLDPDKIEKEIEETRRFLYDV